MYDPNIGQWLQEDPIGFAGGDANLRRYVGNDPTNETDPTGEQAFALGGVKSEEMVNQLRSNGIDAYAAPLGEAKVFSDGRKEHKYPLYLILASSKTIPVDKERLPMSGVQNNARGSFTNNKVFFNTPSGEDNIDLDPEKLTSEQRLMIFKANLVLYGGSPVTRAGLKSSIGYQDFKDQGWKKAGLGAVVTQLVLQYGNEGEKLLEYALAKNVRIESDNDSFWFTEKEYRNGRIQIAESKRRLLKRDATVAEAASYLYKLLKDNKENIEEWSNRNYNDPSSAAQLSDHMTDPHTGAAMPLHVGGRGGLARGFDDALSEAADQIQGLMYDYALAGLNVQASAAARAAALERGGLFVSQGRNMVMRDATAGADVSRKLGNRAGTLLKGVFNGELHAFLWDYLPEARVIKQTGPEDCTAAASLMFLESRGINNITQAELVRALHTTGRGATMTEVQKVLKNLVGNRATKPFAVASSNLQDLANATQRGPVIVGLQLGPAEGHAVIVDKVVKIPGSTKYMVAIRDPQLGSYALFQDDFLRLWTEREYITFFGMKK